MRNVERVPRRAVPHVRELLADALTPLAAYRRLAVLSPVRFLFESVTGGERVSRWSFLGAGPRGIYRLYEDRLDVEYEGTVERFDAPPLEALRGLLRSIASDPGPLDGTLAGVHVPFTGGFVGGFGFDLLRLVEKLPNRPPSPQGQEDLPIATFARFDAIVAFDHAYQRALVIANEIEGEVSADEAQAQLDQIERLLTAESGGGGAIVMPAKLSRPRSEPIPSLDGASYRAAVLRAKEHIAAGDIFQVVLARRFRLDRRVDRNAGPIALYRALRRVNPSPYMVLLETPDAALVGASPEMLVRKTGRRLETRPIAGTRPRSADLSLDRQHAEDLLADPKERAEHLMLVDLGRNDLGRIATAGTVTVPTFMEIERYSHVMHLVSSVEAELAPERDALDALLACFPAGTVSGAPKIRAIEIIDALEPEARGPYAGAVGYFSYTGDLDTCIAIRTLVVREDETSVTAGAGIVADSDPAAEQRETENKAAGMFAAVDLAEEIAAADSPRKGERS